ncbi:MAG: VWA domain-containing protein [Holophagales bacterium]|nr:VWA domain-containing protein [Holophagales bacterium]
MTSNLRGSSIPIPASITADPRSRVFGRRLGRPTGDRGRGPRRRAAATLAAALLATPFFATPAFAQDERPQVQGAFGEVIDVRVVNLEVVVEKDGERLRGLGPEDFVLTVDGREVPIEYFTEVWGGVAVASGTDTTGTLPALEPGEPVGTSFLVFVDEHFSLARDRDQVIDGLIEQLPNLQPQDRMAIVAYDGKSVDMLSNWSTRVDELTRVLRRAKARPAGGLARLAEERAFESRRNLLANSVVSPDRQPGQNVGLDIEEESYAQDMALKVTNAARAAAATLRGFANPPGRKVMLLFSGGWPHDPARWVITDPVRAIHTGTVPVGPEIMGTLSETANRLSYTLYTVDVPGVSSFAADASYATVDEAERRREELRTREQEEEFSLLEMARLTGGQAVLGAAKSDAFERVVSDTRSYYWIGFTPSWQGDDTEHDVKVEVRERGAKVRGRTGYSDLSRESEVTMMVESALLFGDAPAAAPLEVTVGRGKRAGFGKRDVPLEIQIPVDELTFLPVQGGFQTELELRVAVLDEEGNTADVPVIPLAFRSERLPQQGERTPYETTLRMRNRQHDMVVSLYDKGSGKILSTKVSVGGR